MTVETRAGPGGRLRQPAGVPAARGWPGSSRLAGVAAVVLGFGVLGGGGDAPASDRSRGFLRCDRPRAEGGFLLCAPGEGRGSGPVGAGIDPEVLAGLRVPVDPNRAVSELLESLPGVGPVIARRIREGRPYCRPADLLAVRGIGRRKLAAMAPRLVMALEPGCPLPPGPGRSTPPASPGPSDSPP